MILLVLITCSFLGCGTNANVVMSEKQDYDVVRIGYQNIAPSLTYFVAKDLGFFEKYNLKVEPVLLGSSNMALDSLLTDEIDFASALSVIPILMSESSSPGMVKLLFARPMTREHGFTALVVKNDSVIRSLSDLEGKQIGVYPGTTATNILAHLLSSEGVDVSSIDFVRMQGSLHMEAFLSGAIDALLAYDPLKTMLIHNYDVRVLEENVYSYAVESSYIGVNAISTRFYEMNPDVVLRLKKAMMEASDYLVNNPDSARGILSNNIGLAKDVVDKLPLLYQAENIDPFVLQNNIDFFYNSGIIEKKIDANSLLLPRKKLDKVRVGYVKIVPTLPLFVAEEKGFFEMNGLQVEDQLIESSNLLAEALVQDSIDAVVEFSVVPVLAIEALNPGNLMIYTSTEQSGTANFSALLTLNNSGINEMNDLVGKKVGVFPGSTASLFFETFLSKRGVDPESVELIKLVPSQQLNALNSGAIDALFGYQPTVTVALLQGNVKAISWNIFADAVQPAYIGCGAMSTKFIENKEDVAKRFKGAIVYAQDFIDENPDEAREILIKYMGLSRDVAFAVPLMEQYPIEDAQHDKYVELADFLYDAEIIQKPIDVMDLMWGVE